MSKAREIKKISDDGNERKQLACQCPAAHLNDLDGDSKDWLSTLLGDALSEIGILQ